MAARRYRFLEELRRKPVNYSVETLENKSSDFNECKNECPDYAENIITEETSSKENLDPLVMKRSDCKECTNECADYTDNITVELNSKKGPFTVKKKDTCGEKFLWKPVKWLQYKKPIGEICFKTNFDKESSFRVINYRERGKYNLDNIQLKVVSKATLPIIKEKKKDLMDLLPLIDPVFHEFYKNIKTDNDTPNIDPDIDNEDPDAEGNGEELD